jgi:hypothetical protein
LVSNSNKNRFCIFSERKDKENLQKLKPDKKCKAFFVSNLTFLSGFCLVFLFHNTFLDKNFLLNANKRQRQETLKIKSYGAI